MHGDLNDLLEFLLSTGPFKIADFSKIVTLRMVFHESEPLIPSSPGTQAPDALIIPNNKRGRGCEDGDGNDPNIDPDLAGKFFLGNI